MMESAGEGDAQAGQERVSLTLAVPPCPTANAPAPAKITSAGTALASSVARPNKIKRPHTLTT